MSGRTVGWRRSWRNRAGYQSWRNPRGESTDSGFCRNLCPARSISSETEIAFVIFPSNRGGYCIQPQKREYSLNYKCSFPPAWLGLENEELEAASGITGAVFCHKGGFSRPQNAGGRRFRRQKSALAEFMRLRFS
ncbi:MAG: MYG1 family protein [Lachnospiraceae bacterium]